MRRLWVLLLLPLAGARAADFSKAPAIETPMRAVAAPAAALPAFPALSGSAVPAALPAAPAQTVPASVARMDAQVARISQARDLDPRTQGELAEQVLEGSPRQELVAAGFEADEADVVLGRVERRLPRIEQALRERSSPALEPTLKSAWLLSVMTGVRPAALFHHPIDEIEPLRRAVEAVNPRLKVAEVGKPGPFPYIVVYDPKRVLEAMQRATDYERRSVSFKRELRKLERSREGPAAALEKWLPGWMNGLPARVDDRVGVLLGYPLNDVADLVENVPPPDRCDGPACVTVTYGGDPNNGVFWLTLDPRHPETRKAAALYRVSLEAAARRIESPRGR